jgi:hypothetical protein
MTIRRLHDEGRTSGSNLCFLTGRPLASSRRRAPALSPPKPPSTEISPWFDALAHDVGK